MPDIKYEEIDYIIHKCKSTLQSAHDAEQKCKEVCSILKDLRIILGEELEKINDIILKVAEEKGDK